MATQVKTKEKEKEKDWKRNTGLGFHPIFLIKHKRVSDEADHTKERTKSKRVKTKHAQNHFSIEFPTCRTPEMTNIEKTISPKLPS